MCSTNCPMMPLSRLMLLRCRDLNQNSSYAERQTIHSFISRHHHIALGSKREPHHIHARDYQLCATAIGRNFDHPATAPERRCHIQISFGIKSQTLWPPQAPEKYAGVTVRIETRDRIKTRNGGTAHIKIIVGSKRQMIR